MPENDCVFRGSVVPWSRGLVVSWSRRPAVSQSRSLAGALPTQSFSVFPSLSQAFSANRAPLSQSRTARFSGKTSDTQFVAGIARTSLTSLNSLI